MRHRFGLILCGAVLGCVNALVPTPADAAEEKVVLYRGNTPASWTITQWTTERGKRWCIADVPNADAAKLELRAGERVAAIYVISTAWNFKNARDDVVISIGEGKERTFKRADHIKQTVSILIKDAKAFDGFVTDLAAGTHVAFSSKAGDAAASFDYNDAGSALAVFNDCRRDHLE